MQNLESVKMQIEDLRTAEQGRNTTYLDEMFVLRLFAKDVISEVK